MILCPSGRDMCAVFQVGDAVCDVLTRICKVTKLQSCG